MVVSLDCVRQEYALLIKNLNKQVKIRALHIMGMQGHLKKEAKQPGYLQELFAPQGPMPSGPVMQPDDSD